jgi:hypothetical protein
MYRERSPNTAEPHDALLVMGGDDGLVLRTRMPVAQAKSLASAGEIEAELASAALVPFFSAKYLRHVALERRPGYAVVELACRLPEDAVRDVVHGRKVTARLLWRPPLWTIAPFDLGVALVVVGLVGWLATGHRSKRRVGASKSSAATSCARSRSSIASHGSVVQQPCVSTVAGFSVPRELELGELAASLRMLGDRFRTSLIHGQIDDQLIAAVEWALDRHHTRAIEILAQAVEDDGALVASAAAWFDAHDGANRFVDTANVVGARQAQRVSRILAAIAPNVLDHLAVH